MLPTFVIGLREGLEAALIVGIVAAFLKQRGRPDLLRWVFVGVSAATVLCVTIGVILDAISKDLPQKQQEGLETVIGAFAVCMVTYMVIWMRRHSRDLKGQLEGAAGSALASGSAWTLVLMAFLAVLREGLETVVFLLAAFNESKGNNAGIGAALGIAVAVVLGWLIYRGGVRLNLSKFFRITGVVLVLVAAGLIMTALHTAHEAGWLNSGQQSTVDLSSLVRPGTVQASLLTGMLGVQPHPVVIELFGWVLYAIPVGLYVGWPPGRGLRPAAIRRLVAAGAAVAAVAAVVCVVLMPTVAPVNAVDGRTTLVGTTLHTPLKSPAGSAGSALIEVAVKPTGSGSRARIATETYAGTTAGTGAAGRPSTLSLEAIAALGGGRLPLGLKAGSVASAPVTYTDVDRVTAWVDPSTGTVVDLQWQETVLASVTLPSGPVPLDGPVATATTVTPATAVATTARALRSAARHRSHRDALTSTAWLLGVLAVLLAAVEVTLITVGRRGREVPVDASDVEVLTPSNVG